MLQMSRMSPVSGRLRTMETSSLEDKLGSLGSSDLLLLLKRCVSASDESRELVKRQLAELEASSSSGKKVPFKKERKELKPFDMSRYNQRHVAMQVQYEGGAYLGFAAQGGDDEETVEKHLFDTLLKLRLIADRKECHYSRCGRTDKGVSALGQVIGLKVRSNLPVDSDEEARRNLHPCDSITRPPPPSPQQRGEEEEKEKEKEDEEEEEKHKKRKGKKRKGKAALPAGPQEVHEIDYCGLMNKDLPEGIRVLGWCETSPEFSARFSAAYRTYRYFFTKKDLDVAAMQSGADLLVGKHDFRNFCKMNVAEVSNFRREVYYANIVAFTPHPDDDSRSVYMLEIKGLAFLWHMVRCIMSVLLLIGEKREEPAVITALLDVESHPGKPQYLLADEIPLVLHECGFDNLTLYWQPSVLWSLTEHYEAVYDRHTIAASRAMNALQYLRQKLVRRHDVEEVLTSTQSETEPRAKRAKTEGKEREQMTWGNVLDKMQQEGTTRYPFPSSAEVKDLLLPFPTSGATPGAGAVVGGKYVGLMQRNTCDVYEERIKHLGGSKKIRFDKHMQLKEEAKEGDTAAFFAQARKQGSL